MNANVCVRVSINPGGNTWNAADELLATALIEEVGSTPRLLNDIISAVRDKKIKVVGGQGKAEELLRDCGAYFAQRVHGTGIAIYVCDQRFEKVKTQHGVRPVTVY